MSINFNRIMCLLGIHKWECETTREYAGDGEYIIRDHNRCSRLGCPRYSMWFTANTERRRYI